MRKHGLKWAERRTALAEYIELAVAIFRAQAKSKGMVKRNKSKGAV
jgi:hypothetical protein